MHTGQSVDQVALVVESLTLKCMYAIFQFEISLTIFQVGSVALDVQAVAQDVQTVVLDVQTVAQDVQTVALDVQMGMHISTLTKLPYAQGATWSPKLMCHSLALGNQFWMNHDLD